MEMNVGVWCLLCDNIHGQYVHRCVECKADVDEDTVIFDGMGRICCRLCALKRGVELDEIEREGE